MNPFCLRITAAGAMAALLLAGVPAAGAAKARAAEAPEEPALPSVSASSYLDYAAQAAGVPDGGEEIILPAPDGEWALEAGERAEWTVSLPQAGRYRISLTYLAQSQQGQSPAVTVLLNGETPFEQSGGLALDTVWVDDGVTQTDNRGNQLQPDAREEARSHTMVLRDNSTVHDGELLLALPAGETELAVEAAQPLVLYEARLLPPAETPSYQEVSAAYPSAQTGAVWELEAEDLAERSDAAIRRQNDQSDPSVSPNSPRSLLLNTVGGSSWKQPGQSITWRLDVPEDGLYTLSFRYRQDLVAGLPSFRRLLIDGSLPFAEMQAVAFPYSSGWRTLTLADAQGEEYLFYLEQGEHTLTLAVTLGEKGDFLPAMEESIQFMNEIYRDIIMVTGVNIDINRDFNFEEELPSLLPDLEALREQLTATREAIGQLQSDGGDQASGVLGDILRQIDEFLKRPSRIPERLDRFRTNISTLSDIFADMQEQPLELDVIILAGNAAEPEERRSSLLEKLWFRVQIVAYSFVQDYAAIGSVYGGGEPLQVWINTGDILSTGVASGRDQAQILKDLIDEDFSVSSGIPVELTLTSVGDSLMQASLSGVGPDAAVFVPEATPVNLALREVAADLSDKEGFEEMREWFYPSALIPYTLGDGVYALPETQSFYMLFYRTDIFESMGLKPPDTWEDFLDVTAALQKNNLEVGVPENQAVFEMLLLQHGGAVFNDDITEITLTTPEAVAAFTQWTDLYSQYGLPLYFDFFNRFRSGEMPMGIAALSFYNQVAIAAPELRGLWRMVPVPGTAGEGGVSRAQSASGTGVVVLKGQREDDAYQFARWWVSAGTQYTFGQELELLMGTAARYHTANREAFEKIPWTQEEREAITRQWEQTTDIPQSPASYYISRSLTNAFRAVLYSQRNPRETMLRYNTDMQKELERKNDEFGLSAGGA